MSNLCMLRHRKVLQDSAGSYDTILQVFHAETFQVLRLKMLQQLLTGGGFGKYPVVQFECEELAAEVTSNIRRLPRSKRISFGPKLFSNLST